MYALASVPSSQFVYAGTWGKGVYTAYITIETTSWISKENELKDKKISALAIHPYTPTIVYAGIYGDGLRWSTNGGESWSDPAIENRNVWSLAVTSTIAYAGVEGGGVYTSTDGRTWTPTGGDLAGKTVCALAVNPISPTVVYAGTSGHGVYKSTNGGENWEAANGEHNELAEVTICALAINPTDTQIIYAGTRDKGIYRSEDGGSTWKPINEGLSADDLSIFALAINPYNPQLVYAATWGHGVYMSVNGGYYWQKLGELRGSASYVYALTLATCPESKGCQILYAGTVDGVWDIITWPWVTYLPIVMKNYAP